MWIPTPVQERLPMFWLLLGLLFIATGIFLGFDYSATFIYLAIGIICLFWSFCLIVLRPRKPEYTWTEPASTHNRGPSSVEEPVERSTPEPYVATMVNVPGLPDLPDEDC